MEERNAVITSAEISLERGCLTSWIIVEWSGDDQGFGGYHLGGPGQPTPADAFSADAFATLGGE